VEIEEAVAPFAMELEHLIAGILGKETSLKAEVVQSRYEPRVSISNSDLNGIGISIQGRAAFLLQLSYLCELHPATNRLTIINSTYKVVLPGTGAPLWHYDYVRDMKKAGSAIAHLNVYAHRNEIVGAMALSGKTHKRLNLQTLHFPFGGPRFRPTIEDVFEMLITEFGIDKAHGAIAKLRASRAKYFERQLESAVFDSPDVAAGALRELGYGIESPNML
jgi:hypothetical protein